MRRKLLTFVFLLGAFASTNVSMAVPLFEGGDHDFVVDPDRLEVCAEAAGHLFDSYIEDGMRPQRAHRKTAKFFMRCIGAR